MTQHLENGSSDVNAHVVNLGAGAPTASGIQHRFRGFSTRDIVGFGAAVNPLKSVDAVVSVSVFEHLSKRNSSLARSCSSSPEVSPRSFLYPLYAAAAMISLVSSRLRFLGIRSQLEPEARWSNGVVTLALAHTLALFSFGSSGCTRCSTSQVSACCRPQATHLASLPNFSAPPLVWGLRDGQSSATALPDFNR